MVNSPHTLSIHPITDAPYTFHHFLSTHPILFPLSYLIITSYDILVWLSGISVEEEVLLRFSFKEAVYKAIHPFLERSVDFSEVEIEPLQDGSAKINFLLKTGRQTIKHTIDPSPSHNTTPPLSLSLLSPINIMTTLLIRLIHFFLSVEHRGTISVPCFLATLQWAILADMCVCAGWWAMTR